MALYMLEGLFEMEVRSVEQDLISYMGQLVLPNVPVKRWIIDLYIQCLLDGSSKGMHHPNHNEKMSSLV